MTSYTWDAILSHVARCIGEIAESKVEVAELVTPPNSELGDIAFGCFKLAKAQGKSPAEIATTIAEKMQKGDQTIASVVAAGPYLNITLKAGEFILRIIQEVERDGVKYGSSDDGAGKSLMLEYAQPNTHKEIHVGHLRNLLLGVSLARLLKRNGWNVLTASYHGDVGAHVAKCLWLLVRHSSGTVAQAQPKKGKKTEGAPAPLSPEEWTAHILSNFDAQMAQAILDGIPRENRTGRYLGQLYAESSKLLEENPDWKTEVSAVQLKLESHDAAWDVLWQETRRWSVEEFRKIFQELGVVIDRQYFESEVVDEGQRIVDSLLAKGVARESQGAIVVNLEEEKLGVFLIRKSDGTSLYATKDLALAFKKQSEFPSLQRSLILVDNRQSLYFKQLFRTLEMMGLKESCEFVGYEFVTLKSGAMSSRDGNVITYQDFHEEVSNFARGETIGRHADWPEGRVAHTAWALAMGGVKYGMLKQDSDKLYVFDLERALSFEGDTGPYIQYAATRLASILRKGNWNLSTSHDVKDDQTAFTESAERRLALHMAIFPRTVQRAGLELKPAIITQWCFGMAQRISDFYRDVNVLESSAVAKAMRLRLVASALSVLLLGLDLLGITVPEEM